MDAPNVGILGAGHFGKTYASVLSANGAKVTAVSARDQAKALALFPGAVFYPDWRALVREAKIDLLVVCLPIHMHFEVLSLALDCGRTILSEKPVAASLEQAEALCERCVGGCVSAASR